MHLKDILSALSGIIFFIAFVPYIGAIVKGKTKPAKASWLIWATLDSIILIGMYFKHSLNGQIVGAVAGAWIIAILAIKYGKPGWTILDKLCLAGAALGILLWQIWDNPNLAIATSLVVILLGSIPTFVSAYKDPSKEDRKAWTIFFVSCVIAIPAIPVWTLENAGQPIVFLVVETVMMYLLYIKPRK